MTLKFYVFFLINKFAYKINFMLVIGAGFSTWCFVCKSPFMKHSHDTFKVTLFVAHTYINLHSLKLFIEQQKKALKIFDLGIWCTKEPFGYRVSLWYILMPCPGQLLIFGFHLFNFIFLNLDHLNTFQKYSRFITNHTKLG